MQHDGPWAPTPETLRSSPRRLGTGSTRSRRTSRSTRTEPRHLCAEARTQCEPELAIAYYRAALDLVEGEPLGNVLSGYSWWEAEGHSGRVAAVLVDAACAMARLATGAGHFGLARWGIEQARMVEPYSEALSRAAMEVAAAAGDADRLRLEWRACQRMVDSLDPGCSPSLRTETLYGELSRRVLVPADPGESTERSVTVGG